ncbi:MAG TPA: hypothetical protein VF996_03420 [Candidatus Saccharimonadales bacterium]|jgi:hypothetical protein
MAESKGFDINRAMEDIKKDKKLALAVGGFSATIVGLFLPWYEASVFGVRISSSPGLNSTGLLITIAAVVGGGAVLNVMNKDTKQMRTFALVSAAVAALVVFANYPDSELGSLVSVSLGYWLSLAGAVAALAGSYMQKAAGRTPTLPAA